MIDDNLSVQLINYQLSVIMAQCSKNKNLPFLGDLINLEKSTLAQKPLVQRFVPALWLWPHDVDVWHKDHYAGVEQSSYKTTQNDAKSAHLCNRLLFPCLHNKSIV
jgi:hypothetical protein